MNFILKTVIADKQKEASGDKDQTASQYMASPNNEDKDQHHPMTIGEFWQKQFALMEEGLHK